MSVPSLFGPEEAPAASPASAGTEPTTLYRKYRPQSFDDRELVGQEPIVRTLRNAIRLDRVAHAYLFCGPHGTGKTTTARILARAVNCLDPDPDRRPCNACANYLAIARGATTDIVEIDAASNRGIDDIRDLRERVKYAPSQLKVKFYIVDEAHQITGAAANAFLKTLEEPPAHTRFVLATTDPEELLPTVVSRCQRFDFRRIGSDAMVGRLADIAGRDRITIDDDALRMVARHANGSLRDGLGLLDQLALLDADTASSPVTADDVRALLGLSRLDRVAGIVRGIADHDVTTALRVVNDAIEQGEDPRQLNRQLVAILRQLLHRRAGAISDLDDATAALADRFELTQLADLARRFGEIDFSIRHAPYPALPLEVAIVEASLGDAAPRRGEVAPNSPSESAVADGPRPTRHVSPGDAPERPATTRLRDRVRGTPATASSNPPAVTPANEATPAPEPPAFEARPVPAPEPPREASERHGSVAPVPAAGNGTDGITVEQLAELWPRIRQDVKAVNRRVEALLSEADPAFVAAGTITIATPYPFHRDKLNTDDVRTVVESVVGRLTRQTVRIACVLREDIDRLAPSDFPAAPAVPARSDPPRAAAVGTPPAVAEESAGRYELAPADLAEARLRAAMNIFDAEPVDES